MLQASDAVNHKPGGGYVRIVDAPVNFKNASPKIPLACDALKHQPKGMILNNI